ncbi:hypothetical protein F1188_16095 [Roseospira marina]|uniref:Uncharacterized protein n=1 Tax=Roseospira marina TaxID=140057 RepID=A0A5M6I864_9PROT|nr:hypothetical protein [Roseospira marina]KAA5604381.1 hypothetical protein F1188_16095 [Roseospira marina]MBB4315430.1 hypothetical protein [Roseospira marina]MBB5088424.1 hypothetical protein [Roseospira marina]
MIDERLRPIARRPARPNRIPYTTIELDAAINEIVGHTRAANVRACVPSPRLDLLSMAADLAFMNARTSPAVEVVRQALRDLKSDEGALKPEAAE